MSNWVCAFESNFDGTVDDWLQGHQKSSKGADQDKSGPLVLGNIGLEGSELYGW